MEHAYRAVGDHGICTKYGDIAGRVRDDATRYDTVHADGDEVEGPVEEVVDLDLLSGSDGDIVYLRFELWSLLAGHHTRYWNKGPTLLLTLIFFCAGAGAEVRLIVAEAAMSGSITTKPPIETRNLEISIFAT